REGAPRGDGTPVTARFPDARILAVDDQPANVLLLERLLERWEYRNVTTTTSSSEAVAHVGRDTPDLLLLDLHMPDPDGFEVMRLLAPWTRGEKRMPILVLTADVTTETKQRALAAGARDFLTKPFDPVEVLLRVENLLEAHRLQEELQGANRHLEERVVARTRELERARRETLDRLVVAGEFRDDDTNEHAQRVGRTAGLLAAAVGLDAAAAELLRASAPLHDIGKIGISDTILLKPGRLTQDEYEVMKTHAAIGAQILSGSSSEVLELAAVVALSHHEQWSGGGYPSGLAGDAIPLPGRLTAVADVFDALTHDRPYKSAWTVEEAVAEIRRGRGAQFDPGVVDAFAALDHAALLEPVA
ncbi:MAG TPA: HD domain-containing phosphohydrolase, partial [Solirubrobacteraceae bacterium]|nr:HD domain-containing phosphohydrolase [Solirubrobacteraceae bacterium]